MAPCGIPTGSIRKGTASTRKPREALLHPEAGDLGDLVAHLGVGDVQVGLLGVEAVQVPLAGRLVPGPVRVLLVGEDHVAGALARLLVAPHVPVVEGGVARGAGAAEPRVVDRGVVDDQVGDDPDSPVAGGADHLGEVAERAEARVDGVEVEDVVAVVAVGRGKNGISQRQVTSIPAR